MSDDDLIAQQKKIKEHLGDVVYEWADSQMWDSEDVISSEIATTNSIFDETEFHDVYIDLMDDKHASFLLNASMSGYPRKDDVPWLGDSISFSVEGVLRYSEMFGQWAVEGYSITSAKVDNQFGEDDWSDDEFPNPQIKESRCDNVDDLLSRISTLPKKSWYRGHGDKTWELKSSIARRDNPSYSLERELRLAFENRSTFLEPAIYPLGIEKSNFKMQHHGLPTRLLDWSLSPLIALYFVVCDKSEDKKDGCLWVLDPSQLNKMYGAPFPHILGKEAEKVFEEETGQFLAIHAPYNDLRMKMQQSEFTLHTHYTALEYEQGAEVFLKEKIIIPSHLKEEIRERLSALGVTRETLFPDLDNIAKAIKYDILGEY